MNSLGLDTDRRAATIELLLSKGAKWDGKAWVTADDWRPVDGWINCGDELPETFKEDNDDSKESGLVLIETAIDQIKLACLVTPLAEGYPSYWGVSGTLGRPEDLELKAVRRWCEIPSTRPTPPTARPEVEPASTPIGHVTYQTALRLIARAYQLGVDGVGYTEAATVLYDACAMDEMRSAGDVDAEKTINTLITEADEPVQAKAEGDDRAEYEDYLTPDLLVEAERIAANQHESGRYAAARIMRIMIHRLTTAPNPAGCEATPEMARAFKAAYDESAGKKVAKIYAKGQREEVNIICGLRAALALALGGEG